MPGPEARRPLLTAFWIVAAVTVLRIVYLAALPLDLWVDEAQYWLWGENLDFGYYSKPPLIGWTIRLFTEVLGDGILAIRLPGPLFHGATALILGRLAHELFGPRAGLWTAVAYVTLPMTALGSILISTDTIMAPFFAGGLLFWFRVTRGGGWTDAALAGLLIGVAFLGKYAAIYAMLGAALSTVFVPSMRVAWAHAALALAAFALAVAPNVAWNVANDLTTVSHTMDNVDWVRGDSGVALNWSGLAEFFFTQFAVFGPVLFAALLILPFRRPGDRGAALLWFSLPVIAVVCTQALLSRAYGNWAVAAYFAGTVVVVPWLLARARGWLWAGLAANVALCLAVPAAYHFAPALSDGDGTPYLDRHLGRRAMSERVLALAEAHEIDAIVADDRGILADLFHTGRNFGVPVRAVPPEGAPRHYYAQEFPYSPGSAARVLLVVREQTLPCGRRVANLETQADAYAGYGLHAFLIDRDCQARLF
ncbi:ArnT family glycosyltransferase [Tranquillimonas alkanivorans]|uniref:Dolichyl-phosphate-mannose-protein mannosyltransferase n=1 Tax=Tranquillimonas alkanivorans TaxID=441119 RepID=A0A1I5L3R0_9RHOB|nr:glycosyltransferase family 39 protein [Tranquillimonas alkanivorans]SFO91792.1 Dolichyl-phosphate-mannose-protein mannosyltransferase [Tranquillimonas alkanivorans]